MAGWICGSCSAENIPGTRFCGYCGMAAAAVPASEERRLITALFADLSGFTGLAERLDAEQLLEVIDPIVAALSTIVGRYEGHVEKYAGDALLALFGAPVAHDDDAERALRAAVEMHVELARICEALPADRRSLTLHVGVASGHGIARMLGSGARMDYAVLGDSVVLAQRLESVAPAGETYVGETAFRLTRHRFDLEPVGELELKGKREPVPVWRLVGERTTSTLPAGRLVGRESELSVVDEVLEHGGTLALVGEAGVGKSRLAAEVRARAEARGMRWLHARCLSYGGALAYWPYAELLRNEPDRPASPYVDRLLGLPTDVDLEPEAYRRALHGDIATWLEGLAVERPTVLELEDVHWADESSLALTAELAVVGNRAPLRLILLSRPEAAPRLREAVPDADVLELGPLGGKEVELLLGGLLDEVPPGLAATVHERTEGNPFFVEELARALAAGANPEELPPTVEGVLAARIDVLERASVAVLQTASVIGRRVPLALLARLTVDIDDVDPALDELVTGGFLVRDEDAPRLTFNHALMQDAAYGRLLRRHRRELHRRVAEAAEVLYGAGDDSVELLARHLYLAEAGPKAVEYLLRAADRARGLYANDEALVHLERALETAGGDPEIALALADLRELVGDYDEALRLYSEVRESAGDLRAWRGGAATLRKRGRFDEALGLLDSAPDDLALQLERGWTLSVAGRFEEATAVLDGALEGAKEREDGVVGHLLLQLAQAETVGSRLGAALAHALDAERIFDAEQDLRGLATALRIEGNVYFAIGRLDDAGATLRRGLSIAERVGNVEEIGGCLINLGLVELELGNVAEAIELDRRAIDEFERIGHGSGRTIAYGNLAEKLAAAGELDEALRYAELARAVATEIGHARTVADVQRTMARILLRQGRPAEAAQRAEAAAEAFHAMGAEAEAEDALAVAESARG
jgi:adenylate cyclase